MIGCDIAQISRFNNLVNDNFLNKYFTLSEIEYINRKLNKSQTLAGLYAVKEAFLKALKIGIGNSLGLKDIEVEYDSNGAPKICLNDKIKPLICNKNIDISISHDGDYAFAVCIII